MNTTSEPTQPEAPATNIVDAEGETIRKGSIVGMTDPQSPWGEHFGLVIDPDGELPHRGRGVVVFFNLEVPATLVTDNLPADTENRSLTVSEWDHECGLRCGRKGETTFLFTPEMWLNCPRMFVFQPDRLLVKSAFSMEMLAVRTFGDPGTHFDSIAPLGDLPTTPESYMCMVRDCGRPAERTAFWHHSVGRLLQLLFVCRHCFKVTNGLTGDDMPPLKDPLLDPDGNPLVAEASSS